jgi:hypothetical protein
MKLLSKLSFFLFIVFVLLPLQNISKSELKKFDVFGSKSRPNIFTFVDKLLLIYYNGGSIAEKLLFINE